MYTCIYIYCICRSIHICIHLVTYLFSKKSMRMHIHTDMYINMHVGFGHLRYPINNPAAYI